MNLSGSRAAILAALFHTAAARSQQFEVAVVKPHAADSPCIESNTYPGGRLALGCFTLFEMVREAFDLQSDELSGGPDWGKTERWDITAKAQGVAGELRPNEYRPMLRKLLEQQFHLKLKEETRLVKGYDLVVEQNAKRRSGLVPNTGAPYSFDLKPGLSLVARRVSMKEFAAWLKMPMGAGRQVDDKTGLPGEFDFVLKWTVTPMSSESPPTPTQSDAPTIFSALKEQLGLRLRPARVAGNVYVIEAAQRAGGAESQK